MKDLEHRALTLTTSQTGIVDKAANSRTIRSEAACGAFSRFPSFQQYDPATQGNGDQCTAHSHPSELRHWHGEAEAAPSDGWFSHLAVASSVPTKQGETSQPARPPMVSRQTGQWGSSNFNSKDSTPQKEVHHQTCLS